MRATTILLAWASTSVPTCLTPPPAERVEMVEVWVTSQTVQPLWTIKTEHLRPSALPAHLVGPEIARTPEEVVGRVAHERILRGEAVHEDRLADPEAGSCLAGIHPSTQVLGIERRDGQPPLHPGTLVDVIALCEREVVTLIEAAEVLRESDVRTFLRYPWAGQAREDLDGCQAVLAMRSDLDLAEHFVWLPSCSMHPG